MTQSKMHPEINNIICEAFACYAKATTVIEVKVGERKTISLQLCQRCIGKFTAGLILIVEEKKYKSIKNISVISTIYKFLF